MGGRGEHFDAVAATIHDRQQPAGVGGGVLDVTDARMGREPGDHIEREIRALELRVGVDHDGNVDGVGDGAEVGFDLRIGDRKVRLHDRENAVGAKFLMRLCLRHCVRCRCRGDAGNHGHAAFGRFDGRLHDRRALRMVEIGELTGRSERRQPMHARRDEVVTEPAQHLGANLARCIDRRHQIGKHAVEISHRRKMPQAG